MDLGLQQHSQLLLKGGETLEFFFCNNGCENSDLSRAMKGSRTPSLPSRLSAGIFIEN